MFHFKKALLTQEFHEAHKDQSFPEELLLTETRYIYSPNLSGPLDFVSHSKGIFCSPDAELKNQTQLLVKAEISKLNTSSQQIPICLNRKQYHNPLLTREESQSHW